MNIHYYGIRNCYLGESCGKPVIFPPKDADKSTLTKLGFVQLTDSEEWVHFLSDKEYRYIMLFSEKEDVTFAGNKCDAQNTEIIADIHDEYKNSKDDNKIIANTLAGLSIVFMVIAVAIIWVNSHTHFKILLPFNLFAIISVVLAIALRTIFPENKVGKILGTISTILSVLVLCFLVVVIISCKMALDSCNDFLDGCARMG